MGCRCHTITAQSTQLHNPSARLSHESFWWVVPVPEKAPKELDSLNV